LLKKRNLRQLLKLLQTKLRLKKQRLLQKRKKNTSVLNVALRLLLI
jgi:hypothetical protein